MSRTTLSRLALALALFSTAGCYHAVVDTGRPADTKVVDKPWVSTFVFGLVPAQVINVAAECPRGIAKVETQQTFVNGLVGVVTLGIYTPQSARITCAAARTAAADTSPMVTAADSSLDARRAAVNAAAEQAAATQSAVLVRF
ncbi:MAG TPA: Bor family protein [Gemmatimonadaceae bacterium]|jgi:hypothetical protein|nr:Bor family protein [Gemmatimonadaceae bacterium]